MTALSNVRIAGRDDYPECWRLFLMAHKENGLFPLSPEKVAWFTNRFLDPESVHPTDTGPRGVVGVIGQIGALEGFVILTVGQYWYSTHNHLEEFVIFVDPEHRVSGHAQALVDWMKEQVELTNLPLLTGVISTKRTEAKCRLYRRMLPKIGEFYFLSPKGSTLAPALIFNSS